MYLPKLKVFPLKSPILLFRCCNKSFSKYLFNKSFGLLLIFNSKRNKTNSRLTFCGENRFGMFTLWDMFWLVSSRYLGTIGWSVRYVIYNTSLLISLVVGVLRIFIHFPHFVSVSITLVTWKYIKGVGDIIGGEILSKKFMTMEVGVEERREQYGLY